MKASFIVLFLSISCYAQKTDFSLLKKAKATNGSASFQFSETYLLDYPMYSKNLTDSVYTKVQAFQSVEGLLIGKHSDLLTQNKDSVINQISVITKITVLFNQEYISVIKYRLIQKSDTSGIKFFVAQKDKNKWVETQRITQITENLKTILSLKSSVLAQFEYQETGESFKDIEEIKNKSKDVDGTLNIERLAALLRQNTNLLKKYKE